VTALLPRSTCGRPAAADDTIVVRAQLLRAKGTTLSAAGWDVSIKVRRDNASEWSAMHAE
jgi:hypothetical protein